MRIHAFMPARTHSSSSLLALLAVSHPSIHVTKRWVHPVTGQLVAVTLIYVALLSSLFLLWWRDYVCSLPIRKVYSARNGGQCELSQAGVGRRAPVWESCMMASSWPASFHITALVPLSSKPGRLRPIVLLVFIYVKGYSQETPVSFQEQGSTGPYIMDTWSILGIHKGEIYIKVIHHCPDK